tara:strand:+ start:2261 stop:4870 length:2610 start_codon:yes stop_codon:yes gene_type:complete
MGGDVVNLVVTAVITGFQTGFNPYAMIAAVVLTYAAQRLAPKPKAPDLGSFEMVQQDRKNSFRQPITTRKIVYGKIRVGGPIVFMESTADGGTKNTFLHMIMVVASHEIQSFEEFYINGNKVLPSELDANGEVTNTSSSFYSGGSYLRIQTALGTATQGANPALVSESDGLWTADHTLTGNAYVYTRFKWNRDIYQGPPTIAAVIKGKKIYDTRTSATAYSSNPALVLRDYLTSSLGLGIATTKIDDTTVTTAANTSDEDVDLGDGGTEDRYTANGMIDTGVRPRDNINEILTSMSGALTYSNGFFKMFAAGTGTSVLTITEADIVGNLTVQARLSRRDNFNSIKGKFVSEETEWEQSDYPSLSVASFVTEDYGETIYNDLDLPFTTSNATAQRIAKIQLYEARQPLTVSGVFKCTAFAADINDIIKITHAKYGWSNKEFRVIAWGFKSGKDGLDVTMTLAEYASTSYSWLTTEEQAMADAPNTNLPSAFEVNPPTNLTATESLITTRDNSRVASLLKIDWTGALDAQVVQYEAQYKLNSATTYLMAATQSDTTAEVLDLSAGVYDIRVRAITSLGMSSSYVTAQISISGLSAAPSNVSNLVMMPIGGMAMLQWTKSTDLDVTIGGGVEIRWASVTSGATWQTSVLVDDSIAGNATSAVVPLRAGTYLVKFFDSSSNYSASAATITSDNATILAYTGAATITESTAFAGTKTQVVVLSNELQLASSVTLDDVADFDAIGSFDLLGNVYSTGNYLFATNMDKTSKTRVRLQASTTSSIVNVLDKIDSRSANIDAWADFDGTGDAAVGNIEMYYASTDDDPASGGATWTAYKAFQSVEAYARGFKFKAVLTTSDTAYNIKCSAMSVTSTNL